MIWLQCTTLSCTANLTCPYHKDTIPSSGVEIEKVTRNYLMNNGLVNTYFCNKHVLLAISLIPYDENKDLQ